MAESKVKDSIYCTVNISITFNCSKCQVKIKKILLDYKSERNLILLSPAFFPFFDYVIEVLLGMGIHIGRSNESRSNFYRSDCFTVS